MLTSVAVAEWSSLTLAPIAARLNAGFESLLLT
jgi:hypothetical protein